MDFSTELQNTLGEHIPSEIEELILDDLYQDIPSLSQDHKATFEKYTSLIHLSIKNFGLESLSNFPAIKTLEILELNQNKLKGDDFAKIPTLFPQLYKLKVASNQIESIDCLKVFAKTKVIKIEVENNPFPRENGSYAEALFKLVPNLKTIDGHDAEGGTVETTDYDQEEEEEQSFDGEEDEEVGDEEVGDDEEDDEEAEAEDEEEGDDEEEDDESEEPSAKKKKK